MKSFRNDDIDCIMTRGNVHNMLSENNRLQNKVSNINLYCPTKIYRQKLKVIYKHVSKISLWLVESHICNFFLWASVFSKFSVITMYYFYEKKQFLKYNIEKNIFSK